MGTLKKTPVVEGLRISEGEDNILDSLCIPIYLNQKIVFDLLAIMEDGFSQFRAVKTTSAESDVSKTDLSSKFGVSNVFALLGITLSATVGGEQKSDSSKERSETRVHTPTSLFAKLRSLMIRKGILRMVEVDNIIAGDVRNGEFLEFEGVLRKNPMVHAMESFIQLGETAKSFTEPQPKKKKHTNEFEVALNQMKAVLNDLTHANSVDFIVDIDGEKGVKAVLSAQLDFFSDRNASEIIDGQFRVFGKVVRVVDKNAEERINLLRKSSFSLLNAAILSETFAWLQDADMDGINIPKLVVEIEGPAIQVIPVAIFA